MNTKTLALALLPLTALTLGLFAAPSELGQDPAGQRAKRTPQKQEAAEQMGNKDDNHEQLEAAMKSLMKSQRTLRGLIADPEANQAELQKLLSGMERNTMKAYSLFPPRQNPDMTDEEWSLYHLGYKQQTWKLQGILLQMQIDAHKKDADALKAGYMELSAAKKDSHAVYKPEDE